MKRDITVPISAAVLVGLLVHGDGSVEYEQLESLGRVWFHLLFWPFLASLLRCIILWFQTLIDAARPRDRKTARVGWVISHFIFGPIASYAYYFIFREGRGSARSEDDLKGRANSGQL